MAPQTPGTGAHMVDLLESYLLGDLLPAEEDALEAHLLHCEPCRDECDRLGQLGLMVATLPAATIREIEASVREPQSTVREAQSTVREPDATASAQGPRAIRGGSKRIARSDRPAHSGRGWDSRRLVGAAAAVVAGMVLGAVGWAWIGPDQLTGVPVGNQTVTSLSGQLSVTADDRADGGMDVRAVVVGLRPGVDFELIAVATDQHVYSVTRGRAAGGPQQLVGSVPVPSARILLFAVVQDGDTVVAVTLP